MAQRVAQRDPRARDELRDRVAVHPQEHRDLVVGEPLELAQRERLALARGERCVGRADLLLRRGEQHVAVGLLLGRRRGGSADGARGLRQLAGRSGASAACHDVVARVANGRQQVRAEVQLATLQARQPGEHLEKRLLRGVGRVVARAGDAVGEVERTPLVAVVQGGERRAVAGDRGRGELAICSRRESHSSHVDDRTAGRSPSGV